MIAFVAGMVGFLAYNKGLTLLGMGKLDVYLFSIGGGVMFYNFVDLALA